MTYDKHCQLLLDGGTTKTRFTLVCGEDVVTRTERTIGAANADAAKRNETLRQGVSQEMHALQKQHRVKIDAVYAAGMIGSASGLLDVPHLPAPVDLATLAQGVRTVLLPDIAPEIPFHFIPGVRCDAEETPDIVRGEETELFGAMTEADGKRNVGFLHFGSHNKLILMERGCITRAMTTISGELYWAVCQHTVLRSSVGAPEAPEVDRAQVLAGYAATAARGVTRALFEVRIRDVLQGMSGVQARSYLYGALACADMQAFASLPVTPDHWVLYGRDAYMQSFLHCAQAFDPGRYPPASLRMLSYQESQWLSVYGIRAIQRQKGGAST